MTKTSDTLLTEFGLTIDEICKARDEVIKHAGNPIHRAGRRFLNLTDPGASSNFQKELSRHWSGLLSEAGMATYILQSEGSAELLRNADVVANNILADPVMFRDLTAWCLFHAARDSAISTQMNSTAPRSESHLSGGLLEALKLRCTHWSSIVDAALERRSTTLTLDFVDHSILGGEQATGGDFAIILEVDGKGLQPGLTALPTDKKIIPLLFQAKRYVRPNADVGPEQEQSEIVR